MLGIPVHFSYLLGVIKFCANFSFGDSVHTDVSKLQLMERCLSENAQNRFCTYNTVKRTGCCIVGGDILTGALHVFYSSSY